MRCMRILVGSILEVTQIFMLFSAGVVFVAVAGLLPGVLGGVQAWLLAFTGATPHPLVARGAVLSAGRLPLICL